MFVVWMNNLARDFAGLHAVLPFCIDGCAAVDAHARKHVDLSAFPLFPALANVFLVGLFGIQHSVMAREWLKELAALHLPWQMQRALFVAAASACILLMTALWVPMPTMLFQVPSLLVPVVLALHYAGVALVLYSTFHHEFQIDHFELFGVKQALSNGATSQPSLPPRSPSRASTGGSATHSCRARCWRCGLRRA